MSKPRHVVYTKEFANMICRKLERENKKLQKENEELKEIIKELNDYIIKYHMDHTDTLLYKGLKSMRYIYEEKE